MHKLLPDSNDCYHGATSPHFSPGGGMIAQGFGFTRDFLKERNNSAYCRLKKIPCGFKEQARVRHPGEKCGLGACSIPGPSRSCIPGSDGSQGLRLTHLGPAYKAIQRTVNRITLGRQEL
jgi:hypothetical protein